MTVSKEELQRIIAETQRKYEEGILAMTNAELDEAIHCCNMSDDFGYRYNDMVREQKKRKALPLSMRLE